MEEICRSEVCREKERKKKEGKLKRRKGKEENGLQMTDRKRAVWRKKVRKRDKQGQGIC
jgi:hypothetical protein